MTPPDALTPAARRAAKDSGHGGAVRRAVSPRAPRRVSGPATGRKVPPPVRAEARTASPPPAAFVGRPARARVVVGRPQHAPRRARAQASQPRAPLAARLVTSVRTLPDHRLLDRLVRGRAWIPLLGMMLAGIVAMQVEVLKLGAAMGRNLERSTALQSRNELLRASVASLSDDQRIERMAAKMGMVMPGPTQIKFLPTGSNATTAGSVAAIHSPDSTGFVTRLSALGQLAGQGATSPSGG